MLNAKTLKKLVVITAICAVPVVILVTKGGISAIKSRNALLIPGLMRKPDQITKITLKDHEHTITLQKTDNVWRIAERDNYPVLKDKVDDFLYNLSDLRVVEPKTTNPEYFRQLDVNDVTEPDSNALLITVNDVYNDTLVQLYVGKREGIRIGEEYQEHIFVRKVGDSQTWLVQGIIPATSDFRDWVEQPLFGIVDSDQIKQVEIQKASGEKILISKAKPDQEDFNLEQAVARKGMTLDLDTVNTVPFEIAELEFTDMHKLTGKEQWNNPVKATLETFPGVKLVLEMVKQNDRVMAKIQAGTSPDAKPELQKKVLAFNQDREQWIYELSPEIYKELTLAKDDFFKPIETELQVLSQE